MKITCEKRPRGIALIIVLIVIAILAVLAGNFAASMKVETILARNASFDCEFEWLGRAGIEAARAVLAEGKDPYTALNQKWAGGMGDTNGPFAELDLHHFPVGDTGRFIDIQIEDQDRYFNINMADQMILNQALSLIGVDAAEMPTIVDSILDWRDPDDNRNMSGAETSDYQNSPWLPHIAKNGPFDDISELLLVKGITEQPQIYSRAFATPGASAITRHSRLGASKFEQVAYETTLTELFTTTSGRGVNLNTANAKVLQLLHPAISEDMANAIISGPGGRNGPDSAPNTQDDTPFRSVQELSRVPGIAPLLADPLVMGQLSRICTVQSLIFKVIVKVDLGGMPRTYHALLRRNSNRDIQMLCMDWD
jgi:general secretion pathway protein K